MTLLFCLCQFFMNVESDESLLLLENMWRRRFWEVHMTCERWMVYWGAIFCRLVQYTVEYLPVHNVDVVSSKSFNNRITITHDHDHILSELSFEGVVSLAPFSVNAWLEAIFMGGIRGSPSWIVKPDVCNPSLVPMVPMVPMVPQILTADLRQPESFISLNTLRLFHIYLRHNKSSCPKYQFLIHEQKQNQIQKFITS